MDGIKRSAGPWDAPPPAHEAPPAARAVPNGEGSRAGVGAMAFDREEYLDSRVRAYQAEEERLHARAAWERAQIRDTLSTVYLDQTREGKARRALYIEIAGLEAEARRLAAQLAAVTAERDELKETVARQVRKLARRA